MSQVNQVQKFRHPKNSRLEAVRENISKTPGFFRAIHYNLTTINTFYTRWVCNIRETMLNHFDMNFNYLENFSYLIPRNIGKRLARKPTNILFLPAFFLSYLCFSGMFASYRTTNLFYVDVCGQCRRQCSKFLAVGEQPKLTKESH